jgi:hypothetical protein
MQTLVLALCERLKWFSPCLPHWTSRQTQGAAPWTPGALIPCGSWFLSDSLPHKFSSPCPAGSRDLDSAVGEAVGSVLFSFSVVSLETLQAVRRGPSYFPPICFLSLSVIVPQCLLSNVRKVLFHVFCPAFRCKRQEGKVSVIPSWLKTEFFFLSFFLKKKIFLIFFFFFFFFFFCYTGI